MIHVFILSYNAIEQLASWLPKATFSNNVLFHIIDNGNQKVPTELKKYLLHVCQENIFCAGGWNLCMKIGFYHFNQDKIIIAEDDTIFDEIVINDCIELCNSTTISGARNDMFFYSFIGLHKNILETVGLFDENCFYATCEDYDYKYRCTLKNVQHVSPGHMIPDSHSASPLVSYKYRNLEYIHEKWDNFKSKEPLTPKFRKEYWSFFNQGPYDIFMSEVEYNKFLSNEKQKEKN